VRILNFSQAELGTASLKDQQSANEDIGSLSIQPDAGICETQGL